MLHHLYSLQHNMYLLQSKETLTVNVYHINTLECINFHVCYLDRLSNIKSSSPCSSHSMTYSHLYIIYNSSMSTVSIINLLFSLLVGFPDKFSVCVDSHAQQVTARSRPSKVHRHSSEWTGNKLRLWGWNYKLCSFLFSPIQSIWI